MRHDDPQHIADYGFLSDCQTGALVGRNGSIDWYCPIRFDEPSVFARILDAEGGHWAITPIAPYEIERAYLEDTMVLETTFTTETGKVVLRDALLLGRETRGHAIGDKVPHQLARIVTCLSGSMTLDFSFAPRLEYGLTIPLYSRPGSGIRACGGNVVLELEGDVEDLETSPDGVQGRIHLRTGDQRGFRLRTRTAFTEEARSAEDGQISEHIGQTVEGWRSWAAAHSWDGPYGEIVRRSSMILRALTYQPSGAIVAAATTSLPATPGGDDTWDYRYVWLRDLSLTVRALFVSTCPDEPLRFLDWIVQVNGGNAAVLDSQPIMFGVTGNRDVAEHELEHLGGYRQTGPVRIGNAAWNQHQLDVLGEIVDAVYLMRDDIEDIAVYTDLVTTLANRAAGTWQEPDSGMWEARDKERHYLSSKVMCWVALDRAVKLAPGLGDDVPVETWERERDAIRTTIIEDGWCEERQAFTGAIGSDHLDASVLLMPVVGFLPADDPKMRATIETIHRELAPDNLVRRWHGQDNGFLICTFWLAESLALAGEMDQAREVFDRALDCANDLGLMSEQADPRSGEAWGNVPQAFSHVGLINAAWRLGQGSGDHAP